MCVCVYWWNVSLTILWSKKLGVENWYPAHQQTSNVSLSTCHFWAFFIVYYQLIFHDSRVKLGRIGPRDPHSQLDGLCWASGNGWPNIRPTVLGLTIRPTQFRITRAAIRGKKKERKGPTKQPMTCKNGPTPHLKGDSVNSKLFSIEYFLPTN